MKNKKIPNKISKFEKIINKLSLAYFIFVLIMIVVVTPVSLYYAYYTGIAFTILSILVGVMLGLICGVIRAFLHPNDQNNIINDPNSILNQPWYVKPATRRLYNSAAKVLLFRC